jgi:hypothetical protein
LKLFEVGFETDRQMPVQVHAAGRHSSRDRKGRLQSIYPPGAVEAIDLAALREKLAQLRRWTTNKVVPTEIRSIL